MSADRDERIVELAHGLAKSGQHKGWLSIEQELRQEGYARAPYLLEDELVRKTLDAECSIASRNAQNA